MTWRDHCRPIIAAVLAEHAGESVKQLRAALKAAYPYSLREHHPYKIWNDEIARQMGRKPPLQKPGPRPAPPPDPRQDGFDFGDALP